MNLRTPTLHGRGQGLALLLIAVGLRLLFQFMTPDAMTRRLWGPTPTLDLLMRGMLALAVGLGVAPVGLYPWYLSLATAQLYFVLTASSRIPHLQEHYGLAIAISVTVFTALCFIARRALRAPAVSRT